MEPIISNVILAATVATVATGAGQAIGDNVVVDKGLASTAVEGIGPRLTEAPPR
jgi:hypothetical protein